MSISYLFCLITVSFETRIIPTPWSNSIINPIQKPNCTDTRDTTGYRGIALTSSVYKAYCSSLNERISKWAEETDKISDKQNGFRKNRSTIDHISTLTNLIESGKLVKKSTFVWFVDFRKACDAIDMTLLWTKLANIGLNRNVLQSLKALYTNVNCSVRINGYLTV